MRSDDPPRPFDLLRGWRKSRIGGAYLFRVDQGLAVEAKLASLPAGGRKAVIVRQVEVNAVEDSEPVRASRKDRNTERGQQRQAIAGRYRMQIRRQIRGANHQGGEPRAGAGDFASIEHPPSGVSSMARRSGAANRSSSDTVRLTRSGVSTFGSSTASSGIAAAAARSALPRGVPSPLTLKTRPRPPYPPAARAAERDARALSLASGATASSRSKMSPSAGKVRAFSNARELEAGMKRRLRRGRGFN